MDETFGIRELGEHRLAGFMERLPGLAIAVVGDFFLDKYLVIDRSLSEVSLETGLEACCRRKMCLRYSLKESFPGWFRPVFIVPPTSS